MGFSRRRGRPPLARPKKDMGTPELQAWRKEGLTQEPIDVYLQRGWIEEAQHHAARRFAWLYRLRHGKTWVSALNIADDVGAPMKEEDVRWDEKREKEYHRMVEELRKERALELVVKVTAFGEPILWQQGRRGEKARVELECLQRGLMALDGRR